MNIPHEVWQAIKAAEHRSENKVTTPIEEINDLLVRYPILRYDTHTGVDHPLALLSGLHANDKDVIALVRRHR